MSRPIRPWLALIALAAAAVPPALAQEARQPQVPDLKVEKYTLPNGLEVILHEDHTIPVVGVNIWYKVGSKDEQEGRTGFAHLFEHMMFQGSQHHDKEYFAPIEKLGAQINGSTNQDRTNYFETLPSNGLELALWLESDRMGFLLPALTQAKLDNQRDVVKNERRQRYDNVPYGLAYEAMLEALYPEQHPYRHSTIGSMADLSAASREDVSNFFRKYYAPNNASLAIVGDFRPEEAKELVEKYFGALPRGPEIERPKVWVPTLDAAKHVTMTDRVTLPRTQLTWPTVPVDHPDEAALDVLASVLGGLDKENRLFRALMYDKQVAAGVGASHPTQQLAGSFGVMLTARPAQGLDDLVAMADAEIERLKKEGPAAEEVAKAQATRESGLVMSLQSATRKADFLNGNNVTHGDPLAYKDEMKRLFAVTPDDVKRVANKYLTANRIRLDVNPGEQARRAPEVAVDRAGQKDVAVSAPEIKDSFDRSSMPKVEGNPKFSPPPVVRRKLSNGLEVIVAERHGLPVLSLDLLVKGGGNYEPDGKQGLAPMMANLLTEGTESRDALTLAGELSKIGARLDAGSGDESSTLTLTTLTKHADKALELFADVLLNPSFPDKELERLRKERLASLARRADSPTAIAGIVFPKLLYGAEHPYGRFDTPETVKGLTRGDVVKLHEKLFSPNNAALIVVGDTTPGEIVARLESALKGWKKGDDLPAVKVGTPEAKPRALYLVDKPGSAQSVLSVGHVGVPRNTPDYFPIVVMNTVLGGQFSSRINLNLREEKGYTYGARSGFSFRKGPGPFSAETSVQTAVTKEALAELVRELTEVTGDRPPTDEELANAKDRLVKGFPSRFETTFGLANQLEDLVLHGLPDDYFTTYQVNIEAVTKQAAAQAASRHITPEKLTILVVGDRSKVEEGLKSLEFGKKVVVLDAEGDPVEDKEAAGGGK